MADRIVEVDGVQHHFPQDATDEEISAALSGGTGGPAVNGIGAGLTLTGASKAAPLAARAVTAFAEAPNAAKIGGALARGGTTLATLGHGIATGNMTEALASPIAGWQAGKGGYWLTKGAQGAAEPVGRILGKMAPYAQTLSTLGGAAGVGDLAQMAEPNRKDIGFLGVGGGTPDPEHPALLNLIMQRLRGQ